MLASLLQFGPTSSVGGELAHAQNASSDIQRIAALAIREP
jgi:hypothetical protein